MHLSGYLIYFIFNRILTCVLDMANVSMKVNIAKDGENIETNLSSDEEYNDVPKSNRKSL